jgi:hypothetical protein
MSSWWIVETLPPFLAGTIKVSAAVPVAAYSSLHRHGGPARGE